MYIYMYIIVYIYIYGISISLFPTNHHGYGKILVQGAKNSEVSPERARCPGTAHQAAPGTDFMGFHGDITGK